MIKWIIKIVLLGFCIFMIFQGNNLINKIKANMKYQHELRIEHMNF